jgi:hypothetical protein
MDRQKVTLRLNPEVIELIRQVARDLELSPASLIDCILLDGLKRYVDDGLELAGYLKICDRGRYVWTAQVDPNGLHAAISRKADIT